MMGLLDEPAGKVTAPRRADVRGTPHHLAYIDDGERALLRSLGGGVAEDGGQLLGPAGIPAYDGDDGGGEPIPFSTQGSGKLAEDILTGLGAGGPTEDMSDWRAALRAPIDQTQRNFVSGGGVPAGPIAFYNYGSFPTAPPTIGAMQPLPAPSSAAQPGSLPPVPNVGLPNNAPPTYGMQPGTLARLQQVGVMPRFGPDGLAGNPDFSGLIGRLR